MSQAQFAPFAYTQHTMPSGSSFKPKRKRASWGAADEEEAGTKHIRLRSPTMNHQGFTLPDLVADHSNNTSDDDQAMMDMDQDMPDSSSVVGPPSPVERYESYSYEAGGSGGFGFGPGAEEDEFEMDTADGMGAQLNNYPSLTPHPNPHHFSHHYDAGGYRSNSPLVAQPFSTGLQAPGSRGIFQPTMSNPISHGASDVEKARSQHGHWCKSIPKLIMSEYPDATGRRSMWTVCQDCGACEKAQD